MDCDSSTSNSLFYMPDLSHRALCFSFVLFPHTVSDISITVEQWSLATVIEKYNTAAACFGQRRLIISIL